MDKMINKIMNNTRNKEIIKSTIISPPFRRVTNRSGHPALLLYKTFDLFTIEELANLVKTVYEL